MEHLRSADNPEKQHDNRGNSRGAAVVVLITIAALTLCWYLIRR